MIDSQLLTCSTCKEEKSEESFHVNKSRKRGRHYDCKVCRTERINSRYANDPTFRRRRRSIVTAYRKNNPDKVKELGRKYAKENNWYYDRKKGTKQHKAGNAVRQAIFQGKLKRQPYVICSIEPTEAHHLDYNKPLDVMFLCRPHHLAGHRVFITK